MKFLKKIKIQTFLLILAALLFSGSEALHPLFHAHEYKICCHSKSYNEIDEDFCFKMAKKDRYGKSHKHVCPFCSNPAGKYAEPVATIEAITNNIFSIYFCAYNDVIFDSYREALSRGPPGHWNS